MLTAPFRLIVSSSFSVRAANKHLKPKMLFNCGHCCGKDTRRFFQSSVRSLADVKSIRSEGSERADSNVAIFTAVTRVTLLSSPRFPPLPPSFSLSLSLSSSSLHSCVCLCVRPGGFHRDELLPSILSRLSTLRLDFLLLPPH